jgi:DNA-binding NarL/FixJ family response regulator
MRLALEPDLDVVGEADSGRAVLPLVAAVRPDVVLMDVAMPGQDGIATTAELAAGAPEVAVVVLSHYDDPGTVARALAAGARAFVAKHRIEAQLLTAIRHSAAV